MNLNTFVIGSITDFFSKKIIFQNLLQNLEFLESRVYQVCVCVPLFFNHPVYIKLYTRINIIVAIFLLQFVQTLHFFHTYQASSMPFDFDYIIILG